MADLVAWKNEKDRKPLIIRGARQVGKTWLIKEFGSTYYEQMAYINFEKNARIGNVFNGDYDINRIIIALQAETGLKIKPGTTLIVFDEIQEVPAAITSLKYFFEEAPEYHIIAAGSLLGVAIHAHISFPVGKVEFLELHPLTFPEFLDAMGESSFADIIAQHDWKLISAFRSKYTERLRQYYFVGGMPEAVLKFSHDGDYHEVRKIHEYILEAFDKDFSKYAPVEIVPRIRMLWNSIPAQLSRENRKFMYGVIREGARAKEYEIALSWLIDCGLVHRVNRITKPAIPLKAYEDGNAFKLFMVDVGLLSAMCDLNARILLEANKILSQFKGSLTEQYVLQQLICLQRNVFYWSANRSTAEIDFLLQHKTEILPVEVKAEENLQAKSLKVFKERFSPSRSVRLSMSEFRDQGWLVNIPLYAVGEVFRIV